MNAPASFVSRPPANALSFSVWSWTDSSPSHPPRSLTQSRRLRGSALLMVLAFGLATRSAEGQNETLLHGGAGSVGFYIAPVVMLTELSDRSEVVG